MKLDDLITDLHARTAAIRHDLHGHPELAFGEFRTVDVVAEKLTALGLAVHRGLAGTGVVGCLRTGCGTRAIGLRADMDALPLDELNRFEHRSRHPGKMHACGHDGHTAMLLGAAETLAQPCAIKTDSTARCISPSSRPRKAMATDARLPANHQLGGGDNRLP